MARTSPLVLRVSALEKEALRELAEDTHQSVNALMTKVVREVIGAGPHLFDDGLEGLQEATQQLAAIGRNLNQLVRAVNSSPKKSFSVDTDYLVSIKAHVDGVAVATGRLIEQQKARWAPVRSSVNSDG